MHNNIQKQIKTRLEASHLSIRRLEQQAGLRTNAVRNILNGRSKRPNIQTLQAIADVFECSVNDLLETTKQHTISNIQSTLRDNKDFSVKHKWVYELFTKTTEIVNKILLDRNLNPPAEKVFTFIVETYLYSLGKNEGQIEKAFAEWVIDKSYPDPS